MFHFYTHWNNQKTSGFLIISGSIERERWLETGHMSSINLQVCLQSLTTILQFSEQLFVETPQRTASTHELVQRFGIFFAPEINGSESSKNEWETN